MPGARIERIRIYPLKSLAPVEVQSISVLQSGALEHDRRWAMLDEQGRFINGKRNEKVHQIHVRWNYPRWEAKFQIPGRSHSPTVDLNKVRIRLEKWLSEFLGESVTIQEASETGFPDDTVASGPTLISTATLETIASWFPELTIEEVRLRFRANVEIGGVPAFWEDRLYGVDETDKTRFKLGQVEFLGSNPCQRCVVPTRDSRSGQTDRSFIKTFVRKRKETLPDWALRERFDHFFRLAVNTCPGTIPDPARLRVGDALEILDR